MTVPVAAAARPPLPDRVVAHAAWDAAAARLLAAAEARRTTLLLGEAGTGKTLLLRVAAATLAGRGWAVTEVTSGDVPFRGSAGAVVLVDEAGRMPAARLGAVLGQSEGAVILAGRPELLDSVQGLGAVPDVVRLRALTPQEVGFFAEDWLEGEPGGRSLTRVALRRLAAESEGVPGRIVALLREQGPGGAEAESTAAEAVLAAREAGAGGQALGPVRPRRVGWRTAALTGAVAAAVAGVVYAVRVGAPTRPGLPPGGVAELGAPQEAAGLGLPTGNAGGRGVEAPAVPAVAAARDTGAGGVLRLPPLLEAEAGGPPEAAVVPGPPAEVGRATAPEVARPVPVTVASEAMPEVVAAAAAEEAGSTRAPEVGVAEPGVAPRAGVAAAPEAGVAAAPQAGVATAPQAEAGVTAAPEAGEAAPQVVTRPGAPAAEAGAPGVVPSGGVSPAETAAGAAAPAAEAGVPGLVPQAEAAAAGLAPLGGGSGSEGTVRGGPGLILIARPGDSLRSLYEGVYRGVAAPPFAVVEAANPRPLRPGALVVFPAPEGGWGRSR